MKPFIFILFSALVCYAGSSFGVRAGIDVETDDYKSVYATIGTSAIEALNIADANAYLYGKYAYNFGYYNGNEVGVGITYGYKSIGIGGEVGVNSQGGLFFLTEGGYIPSNGFNITFIARYDDSPSVPKHHDGYYGSDGFDTQMDYVFRIGVRVGFAFGAKPHTQPSYQYAPTYTEPYFPTHTVPQPSYQTNQDSTETYYSSQPTQSSSGTDRVYVRGHYRTLKSGKTTYVRPHTRSRPRRK